MLTSFTLENFKSFREPATLPLAPLTMLAGANASGKSNLVEALRLLSWIVQGTKLSEIQGRLQGPHSPIRGTARQLAFDSAEGFLFSCMTTHPEWDEYSIALEYEGEKLCIYEENIANKEKRISAFEFHVIEPDKSLTDIYNKRVRVFKLSSHSGILFDGGESALPVLRSLTDTDEPSEIDEQTVRNISSKYQHWLSEILFLDPEPKHMRGYSFISDIKLSEGSENLSSVLRDLCRNPDNLVKVVDIVQALPEQDIQKLNFVETPRNEVMVALTEMSGEKEVTFDASLLSDGTLRVLSIAAAVLSAQEGSIVVIEEIDNGIHPSRAEGLLRRLSDISQERNLRLLLTTHNPALLDALPQEAVPDVVFCFRHPETGASQLARLSDLTDYSGLVARGGIGTLMTQGIVDRFVKNPRTPEEKRRQALAWLEEVRAETG